MIEAFQKLAEREKSWRFHSQYRLKRNSSSPPPQYFPNDSEVELLDEHIFWHYTSVSLVTPFICAGFIVTKVADCVKNINTCRIGALIFFWWMPKVELCRIQQIGVRSSAQSFVPLHERNVYKCVVDGRPYCWADSGVVKYWERNQSRVSLSLLFPFLLLSRRHESSLSRENLWLGMAV